MQVAVCDDNTGVLAELDRQLRALPQVGGVSSFSSLDAFLSTVEDGQRFDAALLDIDWDGREAGLDAAEKLEQLSPQTKIIFVTGYNDRFSQKIFLRNANLSGYLVKPVDEQLLKANLDKIVNCLHLEEEPSLTVRSHKDVLTIPFQKILYLESKGHHVLICTFSETHTIYSKLDAVQAELPPEFFRCHKSYIVNMAHIRRFQPSDILLKSGGTVPVSRARRALVKSAYFQYIGQTF